MVWSSSPTRKMSRSSPASSRASSSWVRSRSCDSSTRSTRARDRHERERRRVAAQHPQRAGHEVVHVDHGVGGERGPICSVGCMDMHLGGGRATLRVEGQAGERVVQDAHRGRRHGAAGQPLDDRGTLGEPGHIDARVAQDLPPKGMERAHPDRAVRHTLGLQRRVQPLPQLLRGAPIEGHGAHRRWVGARRDAPADAGDQGRGLARCLRARRRAPVPAAPWPRRAGRAPGGPVAPGRRGRLMRSL